MSWTPVSELKMEKEKTYRKYNKQPFPFDGNTILEDQARVYEDKIKDNCHEINQSYSIIDQKAKLDLNSD